MKFVVELHLLDSLLESASAFKIEDYHESQRWHSRVSSRDSIDPLIN